MHSLNTSVALACVTMTIYRLIIHFICLDCLLFLSSCRWQLYRGMRWEHTSRTCGSRAALRRARCSGSGCWLRWSTVREPHILLQSSLGCKTGPDHRCLKIWWTIYRITQRLAKYRSLTGRNLRYHEKQCPLLLRLSPHLKLTYILKCFIISIAKREESINIILYLYVVKNIHGCAVRIPIVLRRSASYFVDKIS